jgi:hypothetical protein
MEMVREPFTFASGAYVTLESFELTSVSEPVI